MSAVAGVRDKLLALAAELGDARQMAILGEGNVSGNVDENTFLVKASGTSLGHLAPDALVRVNRKPLLDALNQRDPLTDEDADALLRASRINRDALKPSVETMFHAWLLSLPGINFVGHVHAIAVNAVLCSPHAQRFARNRIMPDQVVFCGAESILIPYVDPGVPLARRIKEEVSAFIDARGSILRTILLQSHGIIAIGGHVREVSAALAMAEKSATVFMHAAAMNGPIYMPDREVARIAGRADEHYRQKMLREGRAGI